MTGREALKALADGKRVRRVYADGTYSAMVEFGDEHVRLRDFTKDNWEAFDPPATDEQLIAEMEQLAVFYVEQSKLQAGAYAHCARMLRERKVKPE